MFDNNKNAETPYFTSVVLCDISVLQFDDTELHGEDTELHRET